MTQDTRCKGKVTENWRTYQCQRNAQPGKDYCKAHDPEIQAAKDATKRAKWDTQRAEHDALRALLPPDWYITSERAGVYRIISGPKNANDMRAFIASAFPKVQS